MLPPNNTDAAQRNGRPATQEHRKVKRFRLSAPVLFSWQDGEGEPRRAEGMTRDISLRGLFVLAAEVPDLGAYVEVDAYLPPVNGRGKTFRLHGDGKVLRIEQRAGGEPRFAAEVFFQTEPDETVAGPQRIQ